MKTLILIVIVAAFYSCSTDSSKLQQLEARQLQLEQRIDSLEHIVEMIEKYGAKTDSILMEEVFKKEPGSLLYELENQ